MNHTCLREFLLRVLFFLFFLSPSRRSFLYLSTSRRVFFFFFSFSLYMRMCMYVFQPPVARGHVKNGTDEGKFHSANITIVDILRSSSQFNIEKKRRREREKEMAQYSLSSASTQFMTVTFFLSFFSDDKVRPK